MSEDVINRARRHDIAGEYNTAQTIRRTAEVRDRLEEMKRAAADAGRLTEFERLYTYMVRRRKADKLGGYVPSEDLLDQLLPFALSSRQYARRYYKERGQELTDDDVVQVVESARRETFQTRRDQVEAFFNDARLRQQEVEEAGSGGRIGILPSTMDPDRVDVLARDRKGRLVSLERHRDDRSPFSWLAKRGSRLWGDLGGLTAGHERLTAEERALLDLKQKYGIEIITPETGRRKRQSILRAAARVVDDPEASPERRKWARDVIAMEEARRVAAARAGGIPGRAARTGAKVATVGVVDAFRVGYRGYAATRESRSIQGDIARLEVLQESQRGADLEATREEVKRLRARLDDVSKRNPWAAMAVGGFRQFLKALPIKTVVKAVALVLLMGVALWGAIEPAIMQAAMVLVATVGNFFIAALNGVLLLVFGAMAFIVSIMLNVVTGVVGVAYDAVWDTGLHLLEPVGATYSKPVLAVAHGGLPQVSYMASILTVDIVMDPTSPRHGHRTYVGPDFRAVDASGRLTGSTWWFTGGPALPQMGAFECQKNALVGRTLEQARATLGPDGGPLCSATTLGRFVREATNFTFIERLDRMVDDAVCRVTKCEDQESA